MVQAAEIYRIRDKLGETQAKFAERFGVDQATISRWENTTPKDRMAQTLLQTVLHRWLKKNGKAA